MEMNRSGAEVLIRGHTVECFQRFSNSALFHTSP